MAACSSCSRRNELTVFGLEQSLRDGSGTLAQANAHEPWALTVSAQDHLVAIFKKATLLACRQCEGPAAILRKLEQASTSVLCRSGNSAAAQQITRLKIAAIAGMVGQ
jgi:hypothetical protein